MAEYPSLEESETTAEQAVREVRQLALDELFRVPQAGHSLAIDHSFPEEFVDELSRREVFNKHLFRPNTYLPYFRLSRDSAVFWPVGQLPRKEPLFEGSVGERALQTPAFALSVGD